MENLRYSWGVEFIYGSNSNVWCKDGKKAAICLIMGNYLIKQNIKTENAQRKKYRERKESICIPSQPSHPIVYSL